MKPGDISEHRTYRTQHEKRFQVTAIFSEFTKSHVTYLILPGGDSPHVGATLTTSLKDFASRVVSVEAKAEKISVKGGL